MNIDGCGDLARDLLPEVVAGSASGPDEARVRAHVEACTACADELRLLADLRASRPALPDTLAERIGVGVREGLESTHGPAAAAALRPTPRVPRWALAAAVVAAVAVGIPGLMGPPSTTSDVDAAGALALAGSFWLSEDPLVAGAPVLETLTDDQLERLLEEIER